MIKHHPDTGMLKAYAAGQLPASLSIAVSAHLELCDKCRSVCQALEEQLAQDTFEFKEMSETDISLDFMLDDIMATPVDKTSTRQALPNTLEYQGRAVVLPRALNRYKALKWSGLGGIQRARLPLEEGEVRASLLQIHQQTRVPEHTHRGYELTLLLDGEFEDKNGRYQPGDFLLLDGTEQHSPYTEEGCLCYTVSNAPLHFTQGFSKLLNPIGNLLY